MYVSVIIKNVTHTHHYWCNGIGMNLEILEEFLGHNHWSNDTAIFDGTRA